MSLVKRKVTKLLFLFLNSFAVTVLPYLSSFDSSRVDVDLEYFYICKISVEASYPAKPVVKRVRSKAYAQLVFI